MKLLDWGEDGLATTAETAALRASFRQEVAVWHKLDHPNVTKVQTSSSRSYSKWLMFKLTLKYVTNFCGSIFLSMHYDFLYLFHAIFLVLSEMEKYRCSLYSFLFFSANTLCINIITLFGCRVGGVESVI